MNSKMQARPLPELNLEGNHTTMGHVHGEEARDQIRELAELRIDLIKRLNGLRSTQQIRSAAEAMASYIRASAPDVFEETHATAAAANLEYWELVVAGGFSDVADVVARETGIPSGQRNECTLITLHTRDWGVILLGSWDTHATAIASLILCRRKPINGIQTLALTTAGWPMQQGITSEGYGFAIANLVSASIGAGLPYIAALPHATQSRSMLSAVNVIRALPHASARFYAFANQHAAELVEAAPDCIASSQELNSAHTNHFTLCPRLEGRSNMDSSLSRLAIAQEFISMPPLQRTISDLCRAFMQSGVIQNGTGEDDRTGAVFAIVPQVRELHFACEAKLDTQNANILCANIVP